MNNFHLLSISFQVKTAIPGFLRPVNYSHADLWAVGALAYEMYAMENPFCHIHPSTGNKQQPLDSFNYKESQLPRLPKSVPPAVRHLIHDLLRRNPRNVRTFPLLSCILFFSLFFPLHHFYSYLTPCFIGIYICSSFICFQIWYRCIHITHHT